MADVVSRSEFETFERNVAKAFDEQSRANAEMRTDFARATGELGRKIDEIATKGTDWKAVFSGLGLVCTFGTIVGTLVAYGLNSRMDINAESINRLVERTETMQTNRWTRDQMDAYRDRIDDRFKGVEKETKEEVGQIDATLQREMRLLDDALQREMRMLLDEPLARLDAISDRVTALDGMLRERGDWMANHDREVAAINANQTTRLEAIEKRHEDHLFPRFEKLRDRVGSLEVAVGLE